MRQASPPSLLGRLVVALSLLWFLNELGANTWRSFTQLGSVDGLDASLLWELGASLLAMSAIALALMVMLSAVWVASCCAVWSQLRRARTPPRWFAWAAAALASFSFFHLWYSAHAWFVPGSGLASSPLAAMSGAIDPAAPAAASLAALGVASLTAVFVLVCGGRRSAVAQVGALALATVLFAGAQLARPPAAHAAARPFTAPGSVVLLGVDSLQLNRLGFGGHPTAHAPHIEGFLSDSALLENVWTPLARTYPSWLSMLTGRAPPRHGMRFNLGPDSELAADNAYLPELFAKAGYTTLHATDEVRFSILRPRFGYDRLLHPEMGAEDFLLGSFFDLSVANVLMGTHLGGELFPVLRHNRATVGYQPRPFVESLIAELDVLPRDAPVFLSVHLCGNHWPFSTPAPYAHASPDAVGNSIAMVDDQLGALLAWMERSGLADSATTVMLADHGDGWSGDPTDTTNSHGDSLDSMLAHRVFMGFRAPDLQAQRDATMLRSYDLAPTLLERAGLSAPVGSIEGESFAALLRGEPLAARPVYAETGIEKRAYSVQRLVEQSADWYEIDGDSQLVQLREEAYERLLDTKSYALLEGEWRLVLTPQLGLVEAFEFDTLRGVDRGPALGLSDVERNAMLRRLGEHFELEVDEWLAPVSVASAAQR